MSADSRNERYEWASKDSMEVVEKGTGAVIDLDKLLSEDEEKDDSSKG